MSLDTFWSKGALARETREGMQDDSAHAAAHATHTLEPR